MERKFSYAILYVRPFLQIRDAFHVRETLSPTVTQTEHKVYESNGRWDDST